MAPAARVGDKTSHGGVLAPPASPSLALKVSSVFIEGAPAAVIGSVHTCPKLPDHPALGPSNLVVPKGPPPTVFIGGAPAATVGDRSVCQANIITGARTVFVEGLL
ncbi:putative Zn-binding protein involved in type VI secretion [Saccharothrix tamanrassetensis]|uniref:Putative Zn-binding protein involved in type VI secretion n=1 Tax=Saccharothrix tamanrassetensis TaxID=1051531 RepID=A0A841CIC8_9PSEU|nr:PAAR domain-containing protein [Saccharothrix tamanrassetensis]MBB5958262.1 putative Zn-binding protein involved in type VI secretion [Saccharothrix tamanrassetensis]